MRGHIRKHGTGWQYTVDLDPAPATGKRRQKSKGGFSSKKECEKAMNELMTQIENKNYLDSKAVGLRDYLSYWLQNYAKVNVAVTTHQRYSEYINTISKYIGNYEISEIKPAHIQRFYTTLINESGLSNRTILSIHRMLHIALKHAVQWQMIINNPADNVKPPRPQRTEMKIWTTKTINKFLTEIKESNIYIPVMLALTTGMREGEIAALKWSDIDFNEQIISISHNMQRTGSTYQLSSPKTEKSRRSITMMQFTIKELKEYRKKQIESKISLGEKYKDENFVCSWEDGRPFRPHYISDSFRNYILKLKYPKIRFHDLRHTHATILLSKGVNPKIVSERLGHSTISITLDTYSHVLPNMQKEAVEKIKDVFK